MVNSESFRQLALSFDEVVKQPHFEKTSFWINKKIFATLNEDDQQVVLKLSVNDQSVFCLFDPSTFYPANGAWGKQGYTIVQLKTVKKSMLVDALTTAYCNVASKALAAKYRHPNL